MAPRENRLAAILQRLPGLLDRKAWLATALGAQGVLHRGDVADVVNAAHEALKVGARQDATSWIALGLRWHPDRTLDEIRRRGTFRCSKYKFQTKELRPVADALISHAIDLSLTLDAVAYLRSVSILLRLGAAVRRLDTSLRGFVVRRSDLVLKTVVVLLDSLFMRRHEADHSLSSEDWQYHSIEALAEGGSLIIHRFDEEVGIEDHHFVLIDEAGLEAGLYHKLLAKACKIRKYMDAEVLTDAFDYRVTLRGTTVRVEPPFPEFELSIRLGYIQNTLAGWNRGMLRAEAMNHGHPSLDQITSQFYEEFSDKVVMIAEIPIRRYIFRFPDVAIFRSLFNHDGLLVEEIIYIKEILDNELVTQNELGKFKLNGLLSIFDLIKIYRIFGFVSRILSKHFLSIIDKDSALVYRSLVPVYRSAELRRVLEWCLPNEAIDVALDMLSWTSGSSEMMDLQYRPFLKAGQHFLVPLFITGTANWYRNLAHTQRQRLVKEADEEAASRALEVRFSGVSKHVKMGFEATFRGKTFEIDLLARFGGYLFVFECKHSLTPCSPHELRTSYDHVKKAGSQLSRIKGLLTQPEVEAEVYCRLGWDLPPATEIITCIVSCNGMFPGLDVEGHPVRRLPELQNMIETGIVRVGFIGVSRPDERDIADAGGIVERSLWDGPELTPDFLRKYIRDGFLKDAVYRAMFPVEERFILDNKQLVFPSFALDMMAVRDNIEALFQPDETPADSEIGPNVR
ncbi:hypothetical protein [Inquilinus sp. OTU3971]|uniref:hypothetical protein n=1 Tax=Inquilinus sp. OTU3971 TaxID=3043855 RepID=UPI00313EBD18